VYYMHDFFGRLKNVTANALSIAPDNYERKLKSQKIRE